MAEAAEKAKVMALRKVETGREGDAQTLPRPRQASTRQSRRNRRQLVRWGLLAAGPLVVAVLIGWFWLTGGRYVSTDNAYVQADTVNVATDVAGLVKSILVQDNQHVKAGEVLFTLDDATYGSALASADAEVNLAATQLEALRASYDQSAAEIVKARSDVAYFEKEFQRQTDLATRRVSAEAQLDAARHNLDAARGQLAALEQQQAGIAAQLGGDPTAPIERHPRYLAAVAARDRAQHDLDNTVVKAPIDGMTARVPSLQPGEYLDAGQAAFALVASDHVWIEANPKETDLTWVQPGQSVAVSVDTYPGVQWEGSVASVSPASQSQFSLLPAQNTSGNWVKVVQRIPLRVDVQPEAGAPPLRAGMSAEIEVDTGHQRHLRDLLAWL
ncbi:MAG: HlyD family secretion protein [Geminicoccaceae bacterium]